MSVNPYKWIVGLYAEEAMLSYHGKAAMVEAGVADLAPHLFGVADHAYSQLVGFCGCCRCELWLRYGVPQPPLSPFF